MKWLLPAALAAAMPLALAAGSASAQSAGQSSAADAAAAAAKAAASAAPAATDDAERVRLAVGLLDAGGYETQVVDSAILSGLSMFDVSLRNAMGEAAYADLPASLHDDLKTTMASELRTIAVAIAPDSKAKAARIYARYFTAPELRQLTELHGNPVFQKLQSVSPQLMTELMTMGMEAFQPHTQTLQTRIQEVIGRWLNTNKEARPL